MVSYMPTLSERMNELRLKGYKEDFNIQCDGIDSGNGCIKLSPDDFHIDAYYRFGRFSYRCLLSFRRTVRPGRRSSIICYFIRAVRT